MKRMVEVIGLSAVLLAFAAVCIAQISHSGAGPLLTDDAGGYSFTAPAGWKSNRGDVGFTLVNPTKTIIIAVKPHDYANFEAAVRDTQLDDSSRVVGKSQDLRNGGKTVRVAQTTPNGTLIIDLFVLFSPNGGGTSIIAMSNAANADAAFNAGLDLSEGVTFVKRERRSSAVNGASSPWHSALTGKHLLYMYSGNGYFEEKHIYLCSSGVFLQKTGSGGFSPGDVDGGSFAGRGGHRGSWRISGSTLILNFQDGSVGEYALTPRRAGNEVGLNGKRYFVQSQDVCR